MIMNSSRRLLLVFAVSLCSSVCSALLVEEGDVFNVPTFSTTDLQRGQGYGRLADALATTGLISLSMDDYQGYSSARASALGGLCDCTAEVEFARLEGADAVLLGDGQTVRSTLATATVGYSPLPLTSQLTDTCGIKTAQAMDTLRDQVAQASSTFIGALDKLLTHERRQDMMVTLPEQALLRNSYGGAYHTVSSIVQASSNLEHFHVYSKQKKSKQDTTSQKSALQMHTDAGLFLAFVPAHACSGTTTDDKSFYVRDADGNIKQAIFPPNSVAIMLGAGAENWLQTPASVPLRATRHAVNMDAGDSRSWFGMMHLVPESAIVDETSNRKSTFGEMREAMVLKSRTRTTREFQDDPLNVELEDVSIGCGFSDDSLDTMSQSSSGVSLSPAIPRRRLQHVENAGACNNVTNFYCWMSCLEIPQANQAEGYINEDWSLYCVDPSVLQKTGKVSSAVEPCDETGVTGLAMNSNCAGFWQPTAPGVPAQQVNVDVSSTLEEAWCYGGTSMYMDGFSWVGTTCPIYLFPSIVLNSRGALVAACLFTILFGIALEWVIQRRRATVKSLSPGYTRLFVSASFYGVQLTMGYSIMLVVMIYSIPLFLSVVIGIVGGHILFSSPDALVKNSGQICWPSSKGDCCEQVEELPQEEGGDNTTETRQTSESCCSSKYQPSVLKSAPEANMEVAEGSTPCCQHAL